MRQLIKNIKSIPVLLIVLCFVACKENDVTLPKVVAGFTYTLNADTGLVTFINTSENADSYMWSFGDNTTSTEINPSKTYPTGSYTVKLTGKNAAGASATFEDTITVALPVPLQLPINFDDNVKYTTSIVGNVSFAVVDNPDVSGVNNVASKVGRITNVGANWENAFFNLEVPIDFSSLKSVKIKVHATVAVPVKLKFEDGTAAPVEADAMHSGAGWEELYFTLNESATYNDMVIFIDGPGTTAGMFYVDDIEQIDTATIPCTETMLKTPIDFDCNGIDYASKIVGNVSFTVVDNPEMSGIHNTATKVGQFTNVGANWENAFFNLDVPFDFSAGNTVTCKLFSNQALPIKLKFEDGTAAPVEVDVNHGGSGWEELVFVFAGATGSYNDMVIFADGPGTASGTFYIDDIAQTNMDVPVTLFDFEGGEVFTGSFDGGAYGVNANNPDMSGINTSAKVYQFYKVVGAAWYSGMFHIYGSDIDLSQGTTFKIKIWSPNANINIRFQLEKEGGGGTPPTYQVDQTLTQANTWVELTFDFSSTALNPSDGYDKIVIFPDFDAGNQVPVATEAIYYIDDILQE